MQTSFDPAFPNPMMSFDKDSDRSRYRGVYRCGKRWKAQLQSHGIQFYLGMFDTEEEAARAYDRKAREEKNGKNPVNFEIGDDETFQNRPASPSFRYYGGNEEEDEGDVLSFHNKYNGGGSTLGGPPTYNRRPRTGYEEELHAAEQIRRLDYQSTTENMKILWDRHCQIAQRLLLAKAAQSKLAEFQVVAPDTEKETILKALSEEIVLLVVVKAQLEEAVSRCYRLGLDLNTSSVMPSAPGQGQGPARQQNGTGPGPGAGLGSGLPPYSSAQMPYSTNLNPSLPSFGSNGPPSFAASAQLSNINSQLAIGGGGSNGNPFAPLRKPYVPVSAPTGYFGQTFPPSALPPLTLPLQSTALTSSQAQPQLNQANNSNSNKSLGPPPQSQQLQQALSVASSQSSQATSTGSNSSTDSRNGSTTAPSTTSTSTSSISAPLTQHPSGATTGSTGVGANAAINSFQALTRGPSLLGNPSLLTTPALLDTALVGNSRLPPPPQVPLSSIGADGSTAGAFKLPPFCPAGSPAAAVGDPHTVSGDSDAGAPAGPAVIAESKGSAATEAACAPVVASVIKSEAVTPIATVTETKAPAASTTAPAPIGTAKAVSFIALAAGRTAPSAGGLTIKPKVSQSHPEPSSSSKPSSVGDNNLSAPKYPHKRSADAMLAGSNKLNTSSSSNTGANTVSTSNPPIAVAAPAASSVQGTAFEPRKRGRPPSNPSAITSTTATAAATATVTPAATEEAEPTVAPSSERKRGRPPSSATIAAAAAANKVVPPAVVLKENELKRKADQTLDLQDKERENDNKDKDQGPVSNTTSTSVSTSTTAAPAPVLVPAPGSSGKPRGRPAGTTAAAAVAASAVSAAAAGVGRSTRSEPADPPSSSVSRRSGVTTSPAAALTLSTKTDTKTNAAAAATATAPATTTSMPASKEKIQQEKGKGKDKEAEDTVPNRRLSSRR